MNGILDVFYVCAKKLESVVFSAAICCKNFTETTSAE
jgi:hypothetical protein